jgi:hypothetical protein
MDMHSEHEVKKLAKVGTLKEFEPIARQEAFWVGT